MSRDDAVKDEKPLHVQVAEALGWNKGRPMEPSKSYPPNWFIGGECALRRADATHCGMQAADLARRRRQVGGLGEGQGEVMNAKDLETFDAQTLRIRHLEEALWQIAKRPHEKDVADDANGSRDMALKALTGKDRGKEQG